MSDAFSSSSPFTPGPSALWHNHLRALGSPNSLPAIRQMVEEAAQRAGLCDEDVMKIEMAVGEACTNIIEHSYATQASSAPDSQLDIDVVVIRFSDRFEVVIQDYSSINFAITEAETFGELDDWIATGRRRGLGIWIIQSFVDKVEHRFVCGQGNELKLVKFCS
ncbi:serine-protein kinase RsbW [Abditibacteriota bacterium]|nr:serine-protein kinase RsbW [Abditibacteriota bacterium]